MPQALSPGVPQSHQPTHQPQHAFKPLLLWYAGGVVVGGTPGEPPKQFLEPLKLTKPQPAPASTSQAQSLLRVGAGAAGAGAVVPWCE